ncbi:hypothetical protein [Rhodoferax sp.]|uniref:glycine zipper 2TM domain-containing protein n=1 Tax=Rhodoferax sp. TaxID=50421 RepID=UPI00284A11E0|nr:hypothetical protein [Rhodoferax sp.]MDR3368429.1 hypothetical protein [Rhodoferax sp.]
MKKSLLFLATLAASSLSMAQDVGRVISATPVMEQVGVPRQVCSVEQVAVQSRKSGAGALMGAIAGGAMGNAIGNGGGRAVATMVGLMGGAILGDSIEGTSAPQVQNVQRCTTQTFYENRTVAYNVVYDYAGQRYQTQMPNDPGPTIRVNVSPVGASTLPPANVNTTVYEEPMRYQQPAPVVVMPSVRVSYASPEPVFVADNNRWDERRFVHRSDRREDRRNDWQDNGR